MEGNWWRLDCARENRDMEKIPKIKIRHLHRFYFVGPATHRDNKHKDCANKKDPTQKKQKATSALEEALTLRQSKARIVTTSKGFVAIYT